MRRDLFVLIALALALVFPSTGLPQSAMPALKSKSPRVDIKPLMNKANSGDPEAQFGLGTVYQQGLGLDKRENESMQSDRSATNRLPNATQNNPPYLYDTCPPPLKHSQY